MAYTHDMLIDQETGQIDWMVLKQRALSQARRHYVGRNPPTYEVRNELDSLKQIARIMRRRWRESHGLPDDTVYVQMDVAAWGASGDGFGRAA
jgi:class 3 adenylate cyclase